MSTLKKLPIGSGAWTIEVPDGVELTVPADSTGPLKITVDYTARSLFNHPNGIVDLKFSEPAGNVDDLGLQYNVVFEFKNGLGIPLNGFDLFNWDDFPVLDPDTDASHPTKYAHLHNVESNTFVPLTSSVLLQDFITSADFGPAAPGHIAPGQIQATGDLADGETITGKPFVLHQIEQAGVDDDFHMSLAPLFNSGQIILAVAPGQVTQIEGTGADTTYQFKIYRTGDNATMGSTTTTVQYHVDGQGQFPTDGSDFAGAELPTGNVTFAPGETSKTIEISAAGDSIKENNESFTIDLSILTGGGVIVNPGPASGIIVDDDGAGGQAIKNCTAGDDVWPGPAFPGDTNVGDDIVNGLAGSDTITGGPGSDIIDGGTGRDSAVWAGFRTQNTISIVPGADYTVSGPEGDDILKNVERLVFTDGYFVTDVTDPAAVVYRLYSAGLDRVPDQNSLKAWTDALAPNLGNLSEIADKFVASEEFQLKYGNLDGKGYVTQLYHNALNREPDPIGLASWIGALDAGLTRGQVLLGFSESPENFTKTATDIQKGLWLCDDLAATIARLYDTLLDRKPDAAGLTDWKAGVQDGVTLEQVAGSFIGSLEFQQKFGTLDNVAFVKQLYLNSLGREGEESGLHKWVDALNAGVSRADVALAFSESPEHQMKLAGVIDEGIWLL